MHTHSKRLLALVIALSVGLAAVTGGGAAAPAIDTETTDTASVSEIQSGTTVVDFDANSSNTSRIQLQAEQTTNDTKVELWHNASGAVIAENDSGVFQAINTTSGQSFHNHSFDHDELADLERGINDNVTVSVEAYNNTTVANPDSAYIAEFYVESDDSATVQYVSDSDVSMGDIVETTNESSTEIPVVDMTVPLTGSDESTIETNDRSVNNSTRVVLALDNGTVADDFDRVTEGESSGAKLSSLTLFNERAVVLAETDDGTQAVPVFNQKVPDDFDTSRTFALYESVGGTESIVLYQGENMDTNQVALTAVGSTGLMTFADDYIMDGLSLTLGQTAGAAGLVLGGLPLLATRDEPRDWFRTEMEEGED